KIVVTLALKCRGCDDRKRLGSNPLPQCWLVRRREMQLSVDPPIVARGSRLVDIDIKVQALTGTKTSTACIGQPDPDLAVYVGDNDVIEIDGALHVRITHAIDIGVRRPSCHLAVSQRLRTVA